MSTQGNINKLKYQHSKEMDVQAKEVREFIDDNGYLLCEYLLHRLRMQEYHRGALNALIELEKMENS